MMKTKNLLLALCSVAALASCTNDDEPAVAPAMRTVTLSVEVAEPADTRVAYTEDGTTYKFEWRAGDKLRVFYNDGGEKYADFTINSESIDGGKADFTGTLPTDFAGTVTIGYHSNFRGTDKNYAGSTGGKIGFSVASELAARTVLYAENVKVTDGTLPGVKLNHAYAYLLLKKGLQVTDETLTVGSGDTELLLRIGPSGSGFDFFSTGMKTASGLYDTQVRDVYVTNGKLASDYLVPINVGKKGGDAIELKISASQTNSSTAVTQPAHAYVPGKIYEVAADNTKWVATSFN